ncbi:putative TonB-dependent receptor [Parvularcula bermudensis HTCC2503]|uniref:Putative TonB-dependent receptor n=1 Tax=Parvularcula bermudensis (strain ATCC BAA-594 / HTCC2503 / KCTC 12087) TaxID=314260 RepID=E0TBN9_PARBH|nr:TonB-dependent siderophore receptor [Parvularcula bermudensis]ADM09760.1 putative TonB-dependent receptor [Parvularcula bermudensis HTCC2503]
MSLPTPFPPSLLSASLVSSLALATMATGGAAAASNEPAPYGTTDIITVRGDYRATDLSSATKTPTALVNVPQSITVLSREQIDDQAFTDLADVVRFVPGVSVGQGEGHRDQITVRGQNTTADFFIDGLRDDVQYFRPLYNLERVEILKGANALMFGRGGGGGVINRVTKTPVAETTFARGEVSADSFGGAMVAVDANIATTDAGALRFNAYAEHLENHRDVFEGDRYAINPTFSTDLDPNTTLLLSYEFVEDERVVDRGIPSLGGEPVEGFHDTFFGSPDANTTTLKAHIFRGRIDRSLAEGWSSNLTLQYADYDKLYQNLYPIGIDPAAATVSLDGYRDETDRQNFIAQANLVGEFATGPLQHTLLIGTEFTDQDTDNARRDVFFADTADDQITFGLSDPLSIPTFSFPSDTRNRRSNVQVSSLYVQDQIDLTDRVKLIGGLRYDRFDIDALDRLELLDGSADGNDGRLSRSDEEVSPRLGVIYKPQDSASLYASFSRSFLPRSGDQFLSLTPSSEALDPEVFENIEVGFKWDLRPDLSLTGAVFRLERDSGTTVDPDDPDNTILISGLTHGAEIQLAGRLTPQWTVSAGYSYLDAKEDGRVVDGQDADRDLAQVPEHMVSLWNRYDLSDAFSLGLGVHHQSAQYATIANSVELPSYTRVDAAAYYLVNDRLELQLNVENLTDETYYPSAHNQNNISTGEPMNARLTLRTQF